MSTWPRLTPVQKQTLVDFEKAKYGELCCHGLRTLNTVWILKEHGMVDGGTNWFRITQRGRDYVRFVIHKTKGTTMTATQKKIIKRLLAGDTLQRSDGRYYRWYNHNHIPDYSTSVNQITVDKMTTEGLLKLGQANSRTRHVPTDKAISLVGK